MNGQFAIYFLLQTIGSFSFYNFVSSRCILKLVINSLNYMTKELRLNSGYRDIIGFSKTFLLLNLFLKNNPFLFCISIPIPTPSPPPVLSQRG